MIYQAASKEKQGALIEKLIHLNYPAHYPESDLPFGHVFGVWATFAEKLLVEKSGPLYEQLSLKGKEQMREKLVEQLANHCAPTLAALLHVARIENRLDGKTGREGYFFYIEKVFPKVEYLKELFSHFHPLGRTIATQILLYVDQVDEFLSRLHRDRKLLDEEFGAKGKIKELSLSLSDLHNGNRSVYQIDFENGVSLIYKPKPLGLDRAYNIFVGELNDLGLNPMLKTYKILDQGEYGWVEFIHSFNCKTEEEVKRYFEKFGMLICFMFLFEGTDCHFENMLASGEDPVLIDLESLFHPNLNTKTAELLAWNQSVFRTGFFPSIGSSVRNRVDISPLTAEEEQEIPKAVPQWQDVNTDQMQFAFVKKKTKLSIPRPKVDGKLVSVTDHIGNLIAGFRAMYELVQSHKEKVIELVKPLFHYPVRCIFRPTALYFQILQRLTDPLLMRSEEKVEETLEILSRYSLMKDYPHLANIVGAEKLALRHLDIPFFLSHPADCHIYIGNQLLAKECFKNPAKNRVIEKIKSLHPKDLQRQIEFIDQSLYFLKGSKEKEKHSYLPYDPSLQTKPLSNGELLAAAEAIGQKVLDLAQPITDGTLSWIGLELDVKVDRYVFQPLSNSFYGGEAGIALFLASLGKPQFVKRAEEILERLKKPFHDDPQGALLTTTLGGMEGIGGLIYTFSSVGKILNRPNYIEEALYLSSLIEKKKIEEDLLYDLLLGSAGLILVLLSLYEKTGEKSLMAKAKIAGDHLIANAQDLKGTYAWGIQKLCGFSHGAAGISYALIKLAYLSKESKYLDAGMKGILYERSCYSAQKKNWPDFRMGESYSAVSWCHGAPGIGLGRLFTEKFYQDNEMKKEIDLAANTTLNHLIGNLDHICCGTFSRIAFLWELNPSSEAHLKQTAELVREFTKSGSFKLFLGMPKEIQSASFMQGLSGIGYFLLQMSKKNLPQVLVLE